MDAIITSILGAAPQLGVGGVLLAIMGLLLRRETQDRADYRAEIARLNADHDTELADLRKEITNLRRQVGDLNTRLDKERELRRAAEDAERGRREAADRPREDPAMGQIDRPRGGGSWGRPA